MFRKKVQKKDYDRENLKPIIKCSICNGEQVAGFKDIHTGHFEEVMCIKNEQDFELFKEMYGLGTVAKEY